MKLTTTAFPRHLSFIQHLIRLLHDRTKACLFKMDAKRRLRHRKAGMSC
jgi:hypothetical protein